VILLLAAAAIYIALTPHKEISLVRQGNVAAAVDLGGVLVCLAIPLAYSLKGSTSLVDVGLWGVATVAVQLLVFRLVDLVLHDLPRRIKDGEMAAAALLLGAKLATAMIVAAAVAT
jgi:putative membrane protein